MYLFLAVAAIYTYYLFHSNYLNQYFKNNENNDNNNDGNEVDDSYLDEEINNETPEPKEIELVDISDKDKNTSDDKFIEDDKGWSIW